LLSSLKLSYNKNRFIILQVYHKHTIQMSQIIT